MEAVTATRLDEAEVRGVNQAEEHRRSRLVERIAVASVGKQRPRQQQ